MEVLLVQSIKQALNALGLPEVPFVLEHPKELSHGDWATNVALVVAKQVGQAPQEVASSIVKALLDQELTGVERIEIAGPGFINFTLKREVFLKELSASQSKGWGTTELYKAKKILVEHSSPNLFKPFHIGHLMNNTIGEVLFRLAKVSGAQATPISFPSDISLGIAKAIFIILEKLDKDGSYKWDDIVVLGNSYVEGTKRYEEDESIHEKVKEIADNLFSGRDSREFTLFQMAKELNIKYFEQIVAKLGSHFESYIYESEAGVVGKELVQKNTPAVFTESEGAIVYIPEEGSKLHTSVFINSQGNPTYEAKDIGLLDLKFTRYTPDLSLFVTDAQQVSHFQVVLDAARHINSAWAEKSLHRFHGRMSFKGQKMSSRLGGVPLVEDILATVIEEVKAKNPDVTEKSSEQIALSALKFSILKAKAGMNINFDPDSSLSFEGDSGPYLQYSAVRAQSLLNKGFEAGIAPSIASPREGTELLERMIARFEEVIVHAQEEWAPHYLVTYLTELAQYFNSWYGQGKIIDDDKSASAYRLLVVSAVRNTLEKGLWILGIEVPERM